MSATIKTPLVNIRARIVVILKGVAGVGPVYNRVRNIQHEATAQQLLRDAGNALAFWFVTLAASETFSQTRFPAGHSEGRVTFELLGYRALKDADDSENTFHQHVAEVIEAFETAQNKKLLTDPQDAATALAIEAGPVQWPVAGHVMMASALAHQARLTLPVRFVVEHVWAFLLVGAGLLA
jgi:hypothetical protein